MPAELIHLGKEPKSSSTIPPHLPPDSLAGPGTEASFAGTAVGERREIEIVSLTPQKKPSFKCKHI